MSLLPVSSSRAGDGIPRRQRVVDVTLVPIARDWSIQTAPSSRGARIGPSGQTANVGAITPPRRVCPIPMRRYGYGRRRSRRSGFGMWGPFPSYRTRIRRGS